MNSQNGPKTRSKSLELALDMVSALENAGLVVVPLEPTQAMIKAGASAAAISPNTANIVYRAMIAAEG